MKTEGFTLIHNEEDDQDRIKRGLRIMINDQEISNKDFKERFFSDSICNTIYVQRTCCLKAKMKG